MIILPSLGLHFIVFRIGFKTIFSLYLCCRSGHNRHLGIGVPNRHDRAHRRRVTMHICGHGRFEFPVGICCVVHGVGSGGVLHRAAAVHAVVMNRFDWRCIVIFLWIIGVKRLVLRCTIRGKHALRKFLTRLGIIVSSVDSLLNRFIWNCRSDCAPRVSVSLYAHLPIVSVGHSFFDCDIFTG